MTDTYGPLPFSLFKDERLDDAPIAVRLFAAVIKALSNDVDLVEGDPVGLSQILGCSPDDIKPLLAELAARGFITVFKAPNRRREVARVLGSFPGDSERRTNPSNRTKSELPDEEGNVFPGARAVREQARSSSEPADLPPTSRRPSADSVKASEHKGKRRKAQDGARSPEPTPIADADALRRESPTSRRPSADSVRPSAETEERRGEEKREDHALLPAEHEIQHAHEPARVDAPASPPAREGAPAGSGATKSGEDDAPPAQPPRPADPLAFCNAYPWPDDVGVAVPVDARMALADHARQVGISPLELRKRLTEARHGHGASA